MEAQIKVEFEKNGFSLSQEPDILQKCLAYCINYKLSASDLVSHWELYYLNRQLDGLTVESSDMDGFLSHLQNDQKANDIKKEAHLHIYSSNDVDILLSGERDNGDGNELGIYPNHEGSTLDSFSPPRLTFDTNENLSSKKTSKATVNLITPFGQRSNKFVSLYSFNASHEADVGTRDEDLDVSEDDIIRRVKCNERCSLNIHCSRPEPCCRFMYDRTEFKFNYLENRINRYTSMLAACGLYGEPTIASMASEKYIFAVGMICCDGEGHLNEKSILLQGSLEHSGGERVHLDLQKLPELSLFPGQVIGVEGQNPSGHYLIASKVVDALPVAPDVEYPPPKKQALELGTSSSSSKALSLIIASGPFTTTDNLLFEPLAELLAYARRKQPQIVILMGPFVDSEHPDIKMGRVDRVYDDIFNVEILRKLLDYVEYMGPNCRVILSPSTRDAHHISIFPQPAFNIRGLKEINDQITCLTNPCTFTANEIMFGCTTTDILKHLSSEEISRIPPNSSSGDRMGRLAGHVLRQRSFYPLYPPATVFPLDTSLAPEALEIPSVPDVLLLPSDLAPFIKVLPVDENRQGEDVVRCMCVNPGRLAKGIGGGTFVEMAYKGDPDKTTVAIVRI